MEPLLNVEHICFSYHTLLGETNVLSDISFSLMSGEFIAIVGPSGCGKSTLLDLISGLIPYSKGKIILGGKPVQKTSSQIGYMLQKDHLLEWRSITKNVLLGLEIQHKLTPQNIQHAYNLLEKYGLEGFKKSKPSHLSGGMRQRAALVRTLSCNPKLLLLDEPFSALDYQTRLNVANDIGIILKATQTPAILVTHDIGEAISLSDRVIILTKRPCKIKQEIKISFPSEKNTPLLKRSSKEFNLYFNQIWKELNQNG